MKPAARAPARTRSNEQYHQFHPFVFRAGPAAASAAFRVRTFHLNHPILHRSMAPDTGL